MKKILLLLLLSGCSYDLHHQLSVAERKLAQAEEHVAELQERVATKEITRIRKEIDRFQRTLASGALPSRDYYFSEQRQTLARIIYTTPSCAPQAQEVLNDILALITNLSNSQ